MVAPGANETKQKDTNQRKRGCACGCLAGCLKVAIVGVALSSGAYYFAGKEISDLISQFPDPYERNNEEKRAAESAIRALFKGRDVAEGFLTSEYKNSLNDEYWKQISMLELLAVKIHQVTELPEGRSVYCSIEYKDKETRIQEEKVGRVRFKKEDGEWKLDGK